ncbi:MAG TPA: IPT/TIG domain-containing protein [Candidatus Thermoplasmatota archaeon]|nr:IPT/TIG domain-containing protein [Candidatus Thermoplasmatota archaeon]
MTSDQGISDLIGTLMLLVVTVTLIGVAAIAIAGFDRDEELPRLDVSAASAEDVAGDLVVSIGHVGGATLAQDDFRIVITAGADTIADCEAGDADPECPSLSGLWAFGDDPIVFDDTGHDYDPGERVEVQIVSKAKGATLATAFLDIPEPIGGFGIFDLDVVLPADLGSFPIGSVFFLEAELDLDGDTGRKDVATVTADLSDIEGDTALPLYDDGTHGDDIAGDLVYSAYLTIPLDAPIDTNRDIIVDAFTIDGNIFSGTTQLDTEAIELPELEVPVVETWSKFEAAANDVVIVNGEHFAFVNSVSLDDGTDEIGTTWWIESLSGDGLSDILGFIVPLTAPPGGPYSIVVGNPVGFDSGTPINITSLPAPTITDVDPISGPRGTVVTLTGTRLETVFAVFMDGLEAQGNFSTVPFPVSTSELQFIVGSFPTGNYTIKGRGVGGWAEATQTFELTKGPPPTISCPPTPEPDPWEGGAGTVVTVTGTGFSTVHTVLLGPYPVAGTVTDDTELTFFVPFSAAPGSYAIAVISTDGSDTSDCEFLVLSVPPPPPIIDDFQPKESFANKNIVLTGSGLSTIIELRVVGRSGAPEFLLNWVVVNDAEIRFFPTAAIDPGDYMINVTNALGIGDETDCDTSGGDDCLVLKGIEEFSIYNEDVFDKVAHNTSKAGTGGSGDEIDSQLRIILKDDALDFGGQIYYLAAAGIRFEPLKPGNPDPIMTSSIICKPPIVGDKRLGLWLFDWSDEGVENYAQDLHQLRYFYELYFKLSAQRNDEGKPGPQAFVILRVDSSASSAYFVLRQDGDYKEVLDHGWPAPAGDGSSRVGAPCGETF